MTRPYAGPPSQPEGQHQRRREGSTAGLCLVFILILLFILFSPLLASFWWYVTVFPIILEVYLLALLFTVTIMAVVLAEKVEREAKRARTARRRRESGWRFHSRTMPDTNDSSRLPRQAPDIHWEEAIQTLETLGLKVKQLEERLERLQIASQSQAHTQELGEAGIPSREETAALDRKESLKPEGAPPPARTEKREETEQKRIDEETKAEMDAIRLLLEALESQLAAGQISPPFYRRRRRRLLAQLAELEKGGSKHHEQRKKKERLLPSRKH